MNISITKQDLLDCEEYMDPNHCLLATAIKREFGIQPIVGAWDVTLNNKKYEFDNELIHEAYKLKTLDRVDEFVPFELELV